MLLQCRRREHGGYFVVHKEVDGRSFSHRSQVQRELADIQERITLVQATDWQA